MRELLIWYHDMIACLQTSLLVPLESPYPEPQPLQFASSNLWNSISNLFSYHSNRSKLTSKF